MSSTGSSVLHFGTFEADVTSGELRKNGRAVKLQPQPFRLLALLLERQGKLVTREEIQQKLWGGDTFVDFEPGLNFAIRKVREALGDDADQPRYIETLPRRGYRFIAPVELVGNLATQRETSPDPATTPVSRVVSISEGLGAPDAGMPAGVAGPDTLAEVSSLDLEVLRTGGAVIPDALGGVARSHRSERERGQSARATARRWCAPVMVMLVALAAGLYFYRHSRSTLKLTDQDTIVLADFTNTTGDPVFDGTLRQGLSAQLEQSPFLNLLSDARIGQTLALMAQPKDARLTQQFAREVCQRTASAATIEGSIAGRGDHYIVGLQAVNCRTGHLLAEEQVAADGKERVLRALGEAATKLRRQLGEALTSVEKYDAPPENVTTPSLEALQAYSLGLRAQLVEDDWTAAIPLLQRAINLDPNFAMAYARLGMSYFNTGETAGVGENTSKAYELRERVSNRERFYIDSHYEQFVTGDLEAARKTYELWAWTYTRDAVPRTNLGSIYGVLGEYDKAMAAAQGTLRLQPGSAFNYSNLVVAYLFLDRLDEAKASVREAQAHKLDSPLFHYYLYLVDFLQHDRAGIERDSGALMGKPGYEDIILFNESDDAACAGQFARARELTRRAAESVERADGADGKEVAAGYEAEAAVREALAGNMELARRQTQAALALSGARDVVPIAAIALGLAGDSVQAVRLANDLDKRFPKDTIVQSEYLPMIHAASILGTSKEADKAVEALAAAAPYELGTLPVNSRFALYPVYLRADAYLSLHQGAPAATEFQKVLNHPGVVLNEPIGSLAQLGLGRAYSLEAAIPVGAVGLYPGRDRQKQPGAHRTPVQEDFLAKARTAYQDFFALWKDADPDIPILKQAKAEYVRLE